MNPQLIPVTFSDLQNAIIGHWGAEMSKSSNKNQLCEEVSDAHKGSTKKTGGKAHHRHPPLAPKEEHDKISW